VLAVGVLQVVQKTERKEIQTSGPVAEFKILFRWTDVATSIL